MKSEPFLWIHLAGLAALPIFLQIAWIGLAVGDPLPFLWLEWLFLGAIAIIPVFWMQWTKPFDIFSLLLVALKPSQLTPEQLKILSLFKRPRHRLLTLLGVVLLILITWPIYNFAPLAAAVAAYLPQWRLLGLVIAAIALLLSHLFLQVPLSVLGVLATKESDWTATEALVIERIPELFTIVGLKVDKII
ncbi:conserved membrane hypothetical protein [Microcystis aeruginosa PCC 9809]|jgi:hypothetical protein|uniref:Low-complexity tail membrane protein n=2 Tax=Microcystis TaxID=1125 RepID=I4I0T6_MICAE|nr:MULTISPECIES: low-complexity tail membrane protein [Microcystis]NCQ98414.1 low-complexity tail membrane protein [Microcystis aeruginosa L211-11]NCR29911.1 low-complexity tail membrane protein [Microcystis aeruginosa L211-101]REJ48499.1 MAG: low-complexity tail membrane protein [Microcystis flos-aquae DF17]MCZ8117187.1 low-complexity tail membrane protein [Microcystis sp. LE18-22.4A]CCI27910.1 conserved membrane hypothetical protein [Microcystis aeruginosa PCC 9809]